jgi:DNA-binding transcriptional LysR family regulator
MKAMNLNHLNLFYHVAKYKSFTNAAEKLFLTQPGISKQIKDLENYYSCKLFERSGKKVFLTNAGKILFEATSSAFSILDSAKQKIDDLNQNKSGNIRILSGYTPGIHILPNSILKFRELYSNISIHYDISTSEQIIDSLINNTIDIGITAMKGDDRIISIPFSDDEMILAVPVNHHLSAKNEVKVEDLYKHEILITKKGSATRFLVDDINTRFNLKLNIIEFGSPFAIIKSIESGSGISIMSKFEVEKEADKERIQIKSIKGFECKRSFYLNYRKDKYIFSAMREFISYFLSAHSVQSAWS